jgi:translation elongation factor EF-Tu-like GTPase
MFRMTVQDVFVIRGRGAVATGRVEDGELRVGDTVKINDGLGVTVDAIEVLRKKGGHCADWRQCRSGLLFKKLGQSDVAAGDVITRTGFYLA